MKKFYVSLLILVTGFQLSAQVTESDRLLALDLVRQNLDKLGMDPQDPEQSIVTATYSVPGSDVRMVYLQQCFKDIPVYNQLHVLAFRGGQPVSVAGSRIPKAESRFTATAVPSVDPVRAVRTALSDVNAPSGELIVPVQITQQGRKFEFGTLGISSEKVFAELIWFPIEGEREIRLAWQVFVAPLGSSAYWLVRVDAHTNAVIGKEDMTVYCNWGPGEKHDHQHLAGRPQRSITPPVEMEKQTAAAIGPERVQLVNSASYRVIKYPAESPIHPGGSPVVQTNPWLIAPGNATTLGWHDDGVVTYDSTRGNNVFAYEDRDANNQPGFSGKSTTAIPDLTMDFVPNFSLEPVIRTPAPNQQFNTTNLFYWNNLIHDLMYIYGFTETARNYQNSNLGRGGTGGDYVLAEAQDGSGTNNANFSSGVEGTRGRMQMYLWTAPTPDRDGDVDNGIIVHEYGHGVSNRMTGTGSGCLSVVEQMGEGWSDYLGLMMTHDWATAAPGDGFNSPRGIGTYALNQAITGPGIRQYRYTTNMAINPMTYGNLPSVAVPHGVGTIWCTALWDMTWNIIQQAGINANLFNPAGGGGNAIALKLVIEGLRLQPCNPGFITGRDAILRADTLFFGAQYSCAIWDAFARRGMGVGASQGSASVRGDETLSFASGSPAITTQPLNANVCVGGNHTFSLTATGLNLIYQWQLSTDGGATFANISGATASSYSITGVTAGMNNNRYRCIVNGCSPTATSSAVTLSVFTAPAVTQQPVSLSVCEPASASFSVTASGSGTLYQWQVSTDGGVNYGNISGATAATYTIASVTIALNNNRYRCLVSNSGCTTPIITSPAILTVSSVPTILTQPANQTVCLGSNGSLCVSASGTGLAYQWQMASTCSGPWNNVTGGTSSCLTITNPAVTAFYRCVVSSPCASAVNSACAELRVVQPVVISTQPIATELCSGSPATFAISATSSLPITYQWQSSTDGLTWSNLSNAGVYTGVSTPTLGISSAGISLNGIRYRCQMGNGACPTPIFSNAALLTVRQLPVVTLNAAPLTSLLPGKTTTLTATPSGATGGTQTLSWFLNGTAISQTGTTRTVNVEQVGSYRVRLSETYSSGLTCSAQSADVVINATESDKLFIFPSPNDGRFTVSYYNISVTASQRRIVITDSEGKKVYDRLFAVSGPYTLLNIDLRSASRGIYVVQVGDAAGTRLATGKVHVR